MSKPHFDPARLPAGRVCGFRGTTTATLLYTLARTNHRPADDARSVGVSEETSQPKKLGELLDQVDQQICDKRSVSVDDVLDTFGTRAFGPLLAIPALIVISPIGAIPGVPAIFAVFIVLIAGQHLFGLSYPWIPSALRSRAISREKWQVGRRKIVPFVRRIDALFTTRLTFLVVSPMDRIVAAIAILLAITMIPLEFIPFAVAVPGAALLTLGLALSARDGLFVLAGLLATGVSVYLVFRML